MRLQLRRHAPTLAVTAALALLLWPLVYAVWLSFTPGELLEPPTGEWSLRWYRAFFASARWTDGLLNSLLVAALSASFALAIGTPLALAMAHAQWPGHRAADRAVLLPLLIPPVVLGMALLPLMRALGLWGHILSLAAGHSLIALPVVYLVLKDALAAADPALPLAARGLGATRAQTWRWVVLPLLRPAVGFGALAAFVLSLNEFVIALFLATPAIETLPKVIWPNLRYTLTPLVAAASAVTVLFCVAAIIAVAALQRQTSKEPAHG